VRTIILLLTAAVLAASRCSDTDGPPPPPGTPALHLVTSQLSSPVYATSPPGDTLRLFVVQQGGLVRVLRRDTLLGTPFLDLRGKIDAGGERGLLSLAFHPQYGANGRFYVYFTDSNGDIRVVRYLVSAADSNVADEASADTVLKVAHPGQSNHNGGQLQFGPDGKLYAGLGDGGGGGDPDDNGQDRHALLGKILRLDVDSASGYTIPTNNPFATDTTAAPEIWALGVRNPWRFSFDRQTGNLYIADVGQGAWEEVDVQAAASAGGLNYGWVIMEGRHCYPPGTANCNQTGLTLPVLEYDHPTGCSITGGYVYRGSRVPALSGQYLYSDYCTHFVRSFVYSGGQATAPHDWTAELDPGSQVSSFAQDGRGELYIVTLGGGLFRIVATP
jgi:glucose/arabinose dehydrogenase